jgi:hypothetical protein
MKEFGNKLDGIDYIVRPGAYAVIEGNDKRIALIETGNGYFLPGGGIDAGETEGEQLFAPDILVRMKSVQRSFCPPL